ncbi:MAG: hypothetical protein ABSA92_03540 [Candidatus Bathyarchaeia archaeon]
MKTVLSILLGLMLLTSLVGISYATPTVQPTQSTSGNTNNCYNLNNCLHDGGNGGRDPPRRGCVTGKISPDGCCRAGITPHSFEASDIQADVPCGRP